MACLYRDTVNIETVLGLDINALLAVEVHILNSINLVVIGGEIPLVPGQSGLDDRLQAAHHGGNRVGSGRRGNGGQELVDYRLSVRAGNEEPGHNIDQPTFHSGLCAHCCAPRAYCGHTDGAAGTSKVAVVCVEQGSPVLKRSIGGDDRPYDVAFQVSSCAAKQHGYPGKGVHVIIDDSLTGKRQDLAVRGQRVGLLLVGHFAVLELTAFLNFLKGGSAAHSDAVHRAEVGRRPLAKHANKRALTRLVPAQQRAIKHASGDIRQIRRAQRPGSELIRRKAAHVHALAGQQVFTKAQEGHIAELSPPVCQRLDATTSQQGIHGPRAHVVHDVVINGRANAANLLVSIVAGPLIDDAGAGLVNIDPIPDQRFGEGDRQLCGANRA